MWARINAMVAILVLAAAAFVGYRLVKSQITAEVYRDRLVALSHEHEQLRQTYNAAVRKTAVTELWVAQGKVDVAIRTSEGLVKRMETACDPSHEVYVDYVVLDGRLWIRRVFDAGTPAEQATVIDPKLGDIDWTAPNATVGKAVYRKLTDGRWVITVTGDGSLGLSKVEGDLPVELAPSAAVTEFDPVETEVDQRWEQVRLTDVLRRAVLGF